MDDKKIFKILQHWFPALEQRDIPKKKHRKRFVEFLNGIEAEKFGGRFRGYLMKIDRMQFHENEIERCAVFHEYAVDSLGIQTQIRERAKPLFDHYEVHKDVIGRYYNVQDQVYDVVFEEILKQARQHDHELLLIYAEDYYWLIVPNHEYKIEKFCKCFNKQFHDEDVSIEHYALFDCSRST